MADDKNIKKLKKLIEELQRIKGRHTELVTVYIPAGYKLVDVINQLKQEQGTAVNIKSKSTRKNVLGALEKAIQHLKVYARTPTNGLAVFSGNISEKEGMSDIKVWGVEPPETLKVKMYWCGQTFRMEPLLDMVREKEVYGLVVLDLSEATIGILRGKTINVVKHIDSIVPGKVAKGGQSAARFQRVREGLIHDFFKSVAESMKNVLGDDIRGIILGGPGPAKDDFMRGEFLQASIKNRILGVRSTGYADEAGLHELLERGKDLIAQAAVAKEKEILKKFFEHLQKETGLVTYGIQAVLRALEAGAVDILLISEKLDWIEAEFVCSCGYSYKKFIKKAKISQEKCPKCKGPVNLMGERDIEEAMEEMVKEYGTELEVVSRETKEGSQLAALGGIGAMLRYSLA
ncbi:MAG: peptide chain release factor aRF-1 [Candidatus Aenigmatarchaeota archaeon]